MTNNLVKPPIINSKNQLWERPVKNWPWADLLPPVAKLKKLAVSDFSKQIKNYHQLTEQGVKVTELARASEAIKRQIAKQLANQPPLKKINSLQLARAKSQLVITVPANREITLDFVNPIFRHWANLYFVVGANSRVTIIDRHLPATDLFGAGTVYLFTGAASRVDYLAVSESLPSYHCHYRVYPGRGAYCGLYLAGRLAADYYHFTLALEQRQRGSRGDIVAAADCRRQSQTVLELLNNHQSADTTGEIVFRGLGRERAWAEVDGWIKIGRQATETDSYLQEDVLLLSDHSRVQAEPNLEILNSEVKASHGATLGALNQSALFYLLARGLSRRQAEELMAAGFLRAVGGKINNKLAAAELEKFFRPADDDEKL